MSRTYLQFEGDAEVAASLVVGVLSWAASSRYEWALGHSHRELVGHEHWLAEPGQVVYLPAPLVDRLNGSIDADAYERRQVGALTRLSSTVPRSLHDLERDFDPILRPAASPRT